MTIPPTPIGFSQVSKDFPEGLALDRLDLCINAGSVYGLMGRNGSGKTTAIRILAGMIDPTSGSVSVLGHDPRRAPLAVRQRVAYVPQSQWLPPGMSVADLCSFHAALYPGWDAAGAARLARRFELPRARPVGELSRGEQRQTMLLLAFAARPAVLVLDEPAAALDPLARRRVIESLVEALTEVPEAAVLMSTHIISDLERVADRVGIIDHGRMLLDASLDRLQELSRRVQVVVPADAPDGLVRLAGALGERRDGRMITAVTLDAEACLREVRGVPGVEVSEQPLGLEDLYLAVVPDAQTSRVGMEAQP